MTTERSRTENHACGCSIEHHSESSYTLTPCAAHRRPSCLFCGYVIHDEAQTVRDAEKRAAHFRCVMEQRALVEGFS